MLPGWQSLGKRGSRFAHGFPKRGLANTFVPVPPPTVCPTGLDRRARLVDFTCRTVSTDANKVGMPTDRKWSVLLAGQASAAGRALRKRLSGDYILSTADTIDRAKAIRLIVKLP
jgi:hypothetical protein